MIVLCRLFSSGFTSEHIKQYESGQGSSHTGDRGPATATDLLLLLDRTKERLERCIGVSEVCSRVRRGVPAEGGARVVPRRFKDFKLDLKL